MRENNSFKYFKYAIGEIILVVIGILIALQINNWNEGQIQLKQEYKILTSLEADFVKSKERLSETMYMQNNVIKKAVTLLKCTKIKYQEHLTIH